MYVVAVSHDEAGNYTTMHIHIVTGLTFFSFFILHLAIRHRCNNSLYDYTTHRVLFMEIRSQAISELIILIVVLYI